LQLTVPDGLEDDVAAQFYVNPTTVVGLVDAADVPKVLAVRTAAVVDGCGVALCGH
jgi:hypothetical protein